MKKLYPLLIFSIILISCNKRNSALSDNGNIEDITRMESDEENIEKNQNGNNLSLEGHYWKAIELFGEKVKSTAEMKQEAHILLEANGRFSGTGGCNQLSGKYQLSRNNSIHFDENISTTKMLCNYKHFDDKLIAAFQSAKQFMITADNELHFIVGDRAPLAVFKLAERK